MSIVQRRRARQLWATTAVGVGGAFGVAVAMQPGRTVTAAAIAAAAAATAIIGWASTQHRRRESPQERETWLWCFRAIGIVAVGVVAGDLLSPINGAMTDDLPLTISTLFACQALYQGILRWNRFRTLASDPGDWLNGLAGTFAIAGFGQLVVHFAGWPLVGWSTWELQLYLLRLAAVCVLIGTVLTVAVVGNLSRDKRVWMMTAALLVILTTEIVSVMHNAVSAFGPLAQAGWVVGIALVSGAAIVRPSTGIAATAATTTSSTIGALVVLGAGVAILGWAGLSAARGLSTATFYGLLTVVAAATRAGTVVRDLEQVAQSKSEARTDDLTGAANRRALIARLNAAIQGRGQVTLLVWDLNRFKDVNDRHGHPIGDALLCEAVRRAHALLPARSLLARLGGDEFAVLLEGMGGREAAIFGNALVTAIAGIAEVDGRLVQTGASVGIASIDRRASHDDRPLDGDELLRRADASMYRAKRDDSQVRIYDHAADAAARQQAELLEDLRKLLSNDPVEREKQLVLFYQPQQEFTTGRTVAAEALIRWQHPRLGLLTPDKFLALAEERGLIGPLTDHVLRTAAATASRWQSLGWQLRVAANLSTWSLSDPDLLPLLDEILAANQLDEGRMKLEITETTLMTAPQEALQTTREIIARGVGVSIDDYGTGYSSLAYLNDLPATELKIDRTFTTRLTTDPRTAAIVAATIDLGHRLGQKIVAEGVEDKATYEALRELRCDKLQGYFLTRPLPVDAFEAWYVANSGISISHRTNANVTTVERPLDEPRLIEVGMSQ